jgi:hypothetical protein
MNLVGFTQEWGIFNHDTLKIVMRSWKIVENITHPKAT